MEFLEYFICHLLLSLSLLLLVVDVGHVHAVYSQFPAAQTQAYPNWLVNIPPEFEKRWNNTNLDRFKASEIHPSSSGKLYMQHMEDILQDRRTKVNGYVDGEFVDALEHFFWGVKGGIALELGALDGTAKTYSQTVDLEEFGWKRILIDGSPIYKEELKKLSPNAFDVVGAICKEDTNRVVHYDMTTFTGGILEFMSKDFLKQYHKPVWDQSDNGDLTNVNWAHPSLSKSAKPPVHIEIVDCVSMNSILKRAHVDHVNFFILDVEGGEFEVLETISWKHTTFDVICVETEKINRPQGFEEKVTNFMLKHG